ncbi:MAG: PilZ domain-containing protein [Methylotenera sp.]|nr:PilZ domain-containing protein [Oligoflexia bacterium]
MESNLSTALVFIQAEPLSEMQQAAALLEHEGGITAYYFVEPEPALQVVKEHLSSVLVYSIRSIDDLKLLLPFSNEIGPSIKKGSVVLTVLDRINHPNLLKTLKRMGCTDVFESLIKPKALKLKLKRHIQLVQNATAGFAAQRAGGDLPRPELSGNRKTHSVVEVEALTHPADCWIMNAKTVKRFQNRWIFTVMGPAPRFGRWLSGAKESDPAVSQDQDSYWTWTPTVPETDEFVRLDPDGKATQWLFYGRKPEMNRMLWTMVSEKPELILMKQGVPLGKRFSLNAQGDFLLAKNSKAAQGKIPRIKAGFEFEIRLKREAMKAGTDQEITLDKVLTPDLELMLDPEEQRAWNEHDTEDAPPREWNYGRASTPEKAKFFEKVDPLLAPRTGLFELIQDHQVEKNYLFEAAQTKCPVTVWTRGQNFRQDSQVQGFEIGTSTISIRNPVPAFLNTLTELGADHLYCNLNVNRGTVFFTQLLSKIDFNENQFHFKVPQALYEVQRRNHFRLNLNSGLPSHESVSLRIGLGEVDTLYPLVNISRGGACVSLPENYKRKFADGDILPNVFVRLYDKKVRCSAQVRWMKNQSLGIQFIKMDTYDGETLHLFVMEESYEYLAQYVMKA